MRRTCLAACVLGALCGCQRDRPAPAAPDPTAVIQEAMAYLQQERVHREMIAAASSYERKVADRLLADERVDSAFVAHRSNMDIWFMTDGMQPPGATHLNLAVVLHLNEPMTREQVTGLIKAGLEAAGLHAGSQHWPFNLVNHELMWATGSWLGIQTTVGPPQAPRMLDETSYDHLPAGE